MLTRKWWIPALVSCGLSAPEVFASPPNEPPAHRAPQAPRAAPWSEAYQTDRWALVVALLEATSPDSRSPEQWVHLARAQAKLGHLVESLATYEQVRELASSWQSQPDGQRWSQFAETEAATLGHRIPWANLLIPEDLVTRATVVIDNASLEGDRLRVAYPVNPGWHTFFLEVDGRGVAARRVHFSEGEQRTIAMHNASAPIPIQPTSSSAALSKNEDSAAVTSGSTLRTAAVVSLGLGTLSGAIGALFAVRAANEREQWVELSERCGGGTCELGPAGAQRLRDLRKGIELNTTAANVGLIAGAAGMAAGGVMFILSARGIRPNATVGRLEVAPVVGFTSLGIEGRFLESF